MNKCLVTKKLLTNIAKMIELSNVRFDYALIQSNQ